MKLGDDLLTVEEVATYLRKSTSTVYRLARQGKLPGRKIGGTWRFSHQVLDEWICSNAPAQTRNSPSLPEPSKRTVLDTP